MRAATPFFLFSAIVLSACGGSSTDNVTSYENLRTSMAVPFDAEITARTATALTSRPVENSATMTGIFRVYENGSTFNESIAGQLNMNANFAAGTVSGNLTNLIEVDTASFGTDIAGNGSYSGTINVGTGSDDDITATGTGSYTRTSGERFNVTLSMDGDFYRRANSELGAAGTITSTATSSSTTVNGRGAYIVSE